MFPDKWRELYRTFFEVQDVMIK